LSASTRNPKSPPLNTVGLTGLTAMDCGLANRSALYLGDYLDAAERYMRLALKAQGQCRATLETLAVIKNPPLFARQANITSSPQQVNACIFRSTKRMSLNVGVPDASTHLLRSRVTTAPTASEANGVRHRDPNESVANSRRRRLQGDASLRIKMPRSESHE